MAQTVKALREKIHILPDPIQRYQEPINELTLSRFISEMESIVLEEGMRLELKNDFDELLHLGKTLENRSPISPMFNPDVSDINSKNGFWIKGTNSEGECVHLQAMRFDDYTGSNLKEKMESLRAFYRDPKRFAAPGEYCKCLAPFAEHITGKVCYHGELWLKSGKEGPRGKGLGTFLPRIALAIAFNRWAPDFVYAFPWPAIVWKGVLARYGYMHMQPYGMYWHVPGQPLDDSWLTWMTPEDLEFLIRHRP